MAALNHGAQRCTPLLVAEAQLVTEALLVTEVQPLFKVLLKVLFKVWPARADSVGHHSLRPAAYRQ